MARGIVGTFRDAWLIVALHRGGMTAPLFWGTLLFIDPSFVVYPNVVVYLVTVLCGVLLHVAAEPNLSK